MWVRYLGYGWSRALVVTLGLAWAVIVPIVMRQGMDRTLVFEIVLGAAMVMVLIGVWSLVRSLRDDLIDKEADAQSERKLRKYVDMFVKPKIKPGDGGRDRHEESKGGPSGR